MLVLALRALISDALALLVGRQEGHPACKKTEWWGAGVVVCLESGTDLHMAQLMPLPLAACSSALLLGRFDCIYSFIWLAERLPDRNGI